MTSHECEIPTTIGLMTWTLCTQRKFKSSAITKKFQIPRHFQNLKNFGIFIYQQASMSSTHAETFMRMVKSLDSIIHVYDYSDKWVSSACVNNTNRPLPNGSQSSYLYQHPRYFVDGIPTRRVANASGGICFIAEMKHRRRRIPRPIHRCLVAVQADWHPQDVTIPWVHAYLSRILPDLKAPEGKRFNCSHRCTSCGLDPDFCTVATHLTWETQGTNLGRGYRICVRRCTHCRGLLCKCQDIHDPPCI
jgi:hypothetical protein